MPVRGFRKLTELLITVSILVRSCSCFLGEGIATPGVTYSIIYAKENDDGVVIMGASERGPAYEIFQLANHTLPAAECQPNYAHCDLSCFPCKGWEDSKCCTLPVVNATGGNYLAVLQLIQQGEESSFELHDHALITHNNTDCVMAHTFTRASGQSFVVCINTTTSVNNAYIWFLELGYDAANISGTAAFPANSTFKLFPILSSSLSLSEISYVESLDDGCRGLSNVFFVANSKVYAVTAEFNNIRLDAPVPIPDCLHPLDINYVEGNRNLLLRVKCSDYVTRLFSVCNSQKVIEIYDSRSNGTFYQCRHGSLQANLTLRDGLLNFTTMASLQDLSIMPSQNFSFTENIAYGSCNFDSFVFALHNGSVLSLSLSSGRISTLANNSCDNSTDMYGRGQCYKVQEFRTPNIVDVYDYQDSSFKVANLSRPEHPIVARIPVEPRPPMAAIVQGTRTSSSHSTIEPSLTATLSQGVTEPTTTSFPTISVTPPVSTVVLIPPTVSKKTQKSLEFLGLLGILVIAILGMIIVGLIICWWRIRQQNQNITNDYSEVSQSNGNSVNGSTDLSKDALPNGNIEVPLIELDQSPPSPTTLQNRVLHPQMKSSVRNNSAATGISSTPLLPSLSPSLSSHTPSQQTSSSGTTTGVEVDLTAQQPETLDNKQPISQSSPGLLTSENQSTPQPEAFVREDHTAHQLSRYCFVQPAPLAQQSNPGLLECASQATSQPETLVQPAPLAQQSNPGLLECASQATSQPETIAREDHNTHQLSWYNLVHPAVTQQSNPGLLECVGNTMQPETRTPPAQHMHTHASSQQYAGPNPGVLECVEPNEVYAQPNHVYSSAESQRDRSSQLDPALQGEPGTENSSTSTEFFGLHPQQDTLASNHIPAADMLSPLDNHNPPINTTSAPDSRPGNAEPVTGSMPPLPRQAPPPPPPAPQHQQPVQQPHQQQPPLLQQQPRSLSLDPNTGQTDGPRQ